jgi:hypothetical protein
MELVVILDRDTMARTCFGFLGQIEKVVVANGNSI